MQTYRPYLLCACHSQILLPVMFESESIPAGTAWPEDGKPRTILCMTCMRGRHYSLGDVRWRVSRGNEPQEEEAVLKLTLPCAVQGCPGSFDVNVVAAVDTTRERAMDIAAHILDLSEACSRGQHGFVRAPASAGGVALDIRWLGLRHSKRPPIEDESS